MWPSARPSLSDDGFWRTAESAACAQSQRHDLARRLLNGCGLLRVRASPGFLCSSRRIDRVNAASRKIGDGAPLFAAVVFALLSAIVVRVVMVCHLISSLLVPGTRASTGCRCDGGRSRSARGVLWRERSWCGRPPSYWFVYLAVVMNGPPEPPRATPIVPLALTYSCWPAARSRRSPRRGGVGTIGWRRHGSSRDESSRLSDGRV
jgi:hypothetical protein